MLLDLKASRTGRKIAYIFHHGKQFGIILCLFAYVRPYERTESLKHEFEATGLRLQGNNPDYSNDHSKHLNTMHVCRCEGWDPDILYL
jgi:hypothetical protein